MTSTDPGNSQRNEAPKIETINALYHQAFDVLTPTARRSFDEFLILSTHARKVGELALQFYIEEDPTRLSLPNNVNWAAFMYDYVRTDEGLEMVTTGMYAEPGPRDILDVPGLSEMPTHVVQWPDDIEYPLVQLWQMNKDTRLLNRSELGLDAQPSISIMYITRKDLI